MLQHSECSQITKCSNEKIIGTAANYDFHLVIELEEPWDSIPIKSNKYPEELKLLPQILAKNKLNVGINYFAKNLQCEKNFTKIFIFKKSLNEFDLYDKLELKIPNSQLNLFSNYCLDYFQNKNNNLLEWVVKNNLTTTEIFICAHGNRDQCCGKYGLQIYQKFTEIIEKNNLNFRVWKSSHIGGHRYAPTFFEAPSMRWYGLFDINSVENYLLRDKKNFLINNNYRGMSGINNKIASIVECELFKEYSWEWERFTQKSYEIETTNEKEGFFVHFYYNLNNEMLKRTFQVIETVPIENISSCGSLEKKLTKQYLVKETK
ncbi:sucrase ferredoxin [Pigmentibacter sp. JX0631]|uniref:sucrase ferredoxin n=1 Tax=Pigmentibacter sp. JX0631 TaxID=2976982 RepID=UPI002468251C|nr:sucrase ferredoxin [Pigmentibacter sp. JX0631]WGL60543.1 sucrase ferredoxin [Pigmentibacter sp. JX0631]